MKKGSIIIYVVLFISQNCFCQGFFKKPTKSVYIMQARHFSTKYNVDSGINNLVGRKYAVSLEAGLNLEYPINNIWKFKTGINGHLLFLNEVSYGISGPIPSGVDRPFTNIYTGGLVEYIESVSIAIPFKVMYTFPTKEKINYSISGGPFISFYFPASDEMAGFESRKNGELIRQHLVTRHFKNYKSVKSIGISYPQLEWDFDMQATRKFKKYGAISLGIKTHIGTKRLEHATFVIWPTEPAYRSTGHFTLNRSYIGLYGAFTFGQNKK